MAVRTERFQFSKDFPVEEVNRFFEDNGIDRTQILATEVIQKTPDAGIFMVVYEDIIQPYVVGTSPANGADGIPTGIDIIIQFSEAVQAVVPADIEVTRNGSPVTVPPGDIATSGAKVTISNVVDATYGASYVITLLTTIEDAVGNPMAEPYIFQFTAISQVNSLVKKGGNVTPDGADITAGFIDVTFGAAMPDANYRVIAQLVGAIAQPGVGLRISNKIAAGFRINFDGEDFSTVETGIDNADAALAGAIDSAHLNSINTDHANATHAAPTNPIVTMTTTPPGGASCGDRDFLLGNTIDWIATYGLQP